MTAHSPPHGYSLSRTEPIVLIYPCDGARRKLYVYVSASFYICASTYIYPYLYYMLVSQTKRIMDLLN